MSDPTKEFFTVISMSRADIAKELMDELGGLEPPDTDFLSRTVIFANQTQLTDEFCIRYANAIGQAQKNIPSNADAFVERVGEIRRNFLGELGLLPRQIESLTGATIHVALTIKVVSQGATKFSREKVESMIGQGIEIATKTGLQDFLNRHRAMLIAEVDSVTSEIDEDADSTMGDDQTN